MTAFQKMKPRLLRALFNDLALRKSDAERGIGPPLDRVDEDWLRLMRIEIEQRNLAAAVSKSAPHATRKGRL